MTIKMRLDTEGLRALIKDNPALELEIGREVMCNIRDDSVRAKVETQIQACLRGMVTQQGGWPATYKATNPELVKAIQLEAEFLVKQVMKDVLEEAVKASIEKHMAAIKFQNTRTVKELMKEVLTPEMARELMREKFLL